MHHDAIDCVIYSFHFHLLKILSVLSVSRKQGNYSYLKKPIQHSVRRQNRVHCMKAAVMLLFNNMLLFLFSVTVSPVQCSAVRWDVFLSLWWDVYLRWCQSDSWPTNAKPPSVNHPAWLHPQGNSADDCTSGRYRSRITATVTLATY